MVTIGLRPRPARILDRNRWPVIQHNKATQCNEQGSMLIETALVLPPFLMVLFGIFSFSFILFGRGNAIFGANAAARYAALHSATALVPASQASVVSYATAYLFAPASGTNVTAAYNPANTIGGTVTVTVSITYPLNIPFYSAGNVTVSGSAQRTISR